MGSGSTGVAALNANRKFIGVELEEHYYNIAKNRIKECADNLIITNEQNKIKEEN
jgi:DNA modification methylase